MSWKNRIYESLITEKRSEGSRRKTFLRKRVAAIAKRKRTGKSIGALGAGQRAGRAKASGDTKEFEKLKAHGKRYKQNQKEHNRRVRAKKAADPHKAGEHQGRYSRTSKHAFMDPDNDQYLERKGTADE